MAENAGHKDTQPQKPISTQHRWVTNTAGAIRKAREQHRRFMDSRQSEPQMPPIPTTYVLAKPAQTEKQSGLALLPEWLVRAGLSSWLILGVLAIVWVVIFATSKIVPVFIGVFLALVITAILHPIVKLYNKVLPRYPATFLGLLTVLGIVGGMFTYVITSVTGQWDSLAQQFTSGAHTIVDFLEHGPLPFHISQHDLNMQVNAALDRGQAYLRSNAPSLVEQLLSNASALGEVMAVLALALFTAIFFLGSGKNMWRWFLNELPEERRYRTHRAASAGWFTFSGYVRGTMLVALTDGIFAAIFLQMIAVPLAAPLGVLVFMGAFIPMVGAPIAMFVAMLVGLASGGIGKFLLVGIGVAAIGQFEGHILQPLIMGKQVSLHPVVVGIAVAAGSFSAGLLGAVIAVPLVSVAWAVYSELHVRDTPLDDEAIAKLNQKVAEDLEAIE